MRRNGQSAGTIGTTDERAAPIAVPLGPMQIVSEIQAAGLTHVVTVPDTHQQSVLEALAAQDDIPLITVCTEDDAIGVAQGLFMGGCRPLVLIQNAGFYAGLNTIRGLALDARLPIPLMIGEYYRDPAEPPELHPSRLVHMLVPTLALWRIPVYRLDRPADIVNISLATSLAYERSTPVALLVGAPTAELE